MRYQKLILLVSLLSAVLLGGCASNNSSGLEAYNRGMYKINKSVDKYTLKPIAKGYRFITPDPVEKGVSNFFNNISEVGTVANSLLQGKLHNAALSSSRLVWNTTLGIGGIFDVATAMDIKANKEDFGQTLQTWGLPSGPYVVLPLLGPSTVTDTAGKVGDFYLSPITYYDKNNEFAIHTGAFVLSMVDKRAQLLQTEKLLDAASIDEYTFVKNAYLQHRAALVNDGEVQDKALDEDLDDLFGD